MPAMNRVEGAAKNADASRRAGAACVNAAPAGIKCRRPAFGQQPMPGRFEQRRDPRSGDSGDPEEGQLKLVRPAGEPATRLSSSSASILFAATSCGLAASSGRNSSSSRRMVSRSLDRIAPAPAADVHEVDEAPSCARGGAGTDARDRGRGGRLRSSLARRRPRSCDRRSG